MAGRRRSFDGCDDRVRMSVNLSKAARFQNPVRVYKVNLVSLSERR